METCTVLRRRYLKSNLCRLWSFPSCEGSGTLEQNRFSHCCSSIFLVSYQKVCLVQVAALGSIPGAPPRASSVVVLGRLWPGSRRGGGSTVRRRFGFAVMLRLTSNSRIRGEHWHREVSVIEFTNPPNSKTIGHKSLGCPWRCFSGASRKMDWYRND